MFIAETKKTYIKKCMSIFYWQDSVLELHMYGVLDILYLSCEMSGPLSFFFLGLLMKPNLNAAAKTDKQYANSYLYVLCELNASGKIYKQYAHILQLNTTTGCL